MTPTETTQALQAYLLWLMAGSTAERPKSNQEQIRSGQANRWN